MRNTEVGVVLTNERPHSIEKTRSLQTSDRFKKKMMATIHSDIKLTGSPMANPDNWKLSQTKSIRDFRVVSVQERTYEHVPSGKQKEYVVCDSADWVFVIPITPENEVVFIRQFRHGRGEVILEIPGGVMDPGETPQETGIRELREETGYVPESLEMFGPLLPNPGLNTAKYHVAVARGSLPKYEPSPEPFEEIEIELRPLDSVAGMIASGELQHALCIAALAVTGLCPSCKAPH